MAPDWEFTSVALDRTTQGHDLHGHRKFFPRDRYFLTESIACTVWTLCLTPRCHVLTTFGLYADLLHMTCGMFTESAHLHLTPSLLHVVPLGSASALVDLITVTHFSLVALATSINHL